MNTMKDFYASLFSAASLQDSYLEAMAKITRIKRWQTSILMSDLGWQEWGAQNHQNITA